MKTYKLFAALGFGLALGACGATDVVTRDAPLDVQPTASAAAIAEAQAGFLPQLIARQIDVARIEVRVPRHLKVSEANLYYPLGDIVWRGEPMGDRYAQVGRIFQEALTAGTAGFDGPSKVILDVEVSRFHSLSEKARYTVGGVHNMEFKMTLRDAQTGEALSPTRFVVADLEAYGGKKAMDAEARGETQRLRVTKYLAEVIERELTRPEGYANARADFFKAAKNI